MTFGVAFKHRGGTATHLVDVVDFPCGVVQEVQRRLLHQDVVMVGGASHEAGQSGHVIGDFEAQPVSEKPVTGLLVNRADDDMAEFARPASVLARSARPGPLVAGVGVYCCLISSAILTTTVREEFGSSTDIDVSLRM